MTDTTTRGSAAGAYAPSRHQESATLLRIALPLTAAYVAEMGMVITDMVIVGRLGADELAAVGLAGDLFWVFLLIGMGIISIVGVFTAQALGAGDRDAMVTAGEQGMLAATLTSLPIMLCVWLLGPVLSLARQDPNVVALVDAYARVLTWAVLPALWFATLRNYITALAHSAVIGWITIAALGLNLALNYTLVFGRFGFPALGVVGAGIGTTVVTWCMFATLALHVSRSARFQGRRPRLLTRRVDRRLFAGIFRLGIPVALTQILNGGMFSMAAVLVGMLSATTLAAQQILYSVIYLALSAAAGFADAVRVRVAYGVGRGSLKAVRMSARLAFMMAALTTLAATSLVWLAPEALVSVFLEGGEADNQLVLETALALSGAAGLFLLLDGTQLVIANTIRGLRDTRSPLWISLAGYWLVGLGSGIVLCFPLGYGAHGLWWGLVAGVVLCNLLLYRRFRQHVASGLPAEAP